MIFKDKIKLEIKDTDRVYTDEGYLVVPARISRTGTQQYLKAEVEDGVEDGDKVVNVYRSADEVFNSDTLSSFVNKPVTDDHPPEQVNAENAKNYAVGMSGDSIEREGDYTKAKLIITNADAIRNIESGKVELSAGYTADIEKEQGVTDSGEKYDYVQKNIRGNHIAIVERGRAGAACKVADNSTTKGENMTNVVIGDRSYNLKDEQQASEAVTALQTVKTELSAQLKDSKEQNTRLTKELDESKAQLDVALASHPTDDQVSEKVQELVRVVDAARGILGDGFKFDGGTAIDVMRAVVEDKLGDMDIIDKSDDYIVACFDCVLKQAEKAPTQTKKAPTAIESSLLDADMKKEKQKDEEDPFEKARDKFLENQKKGGK